MKTYTTEYIQNKWSTGKPLKLQGIIYRVGKMSYGSYFLEQQKDWNLKETDYHSQDTLWLEMITKKNQYGYNQQFYKIEEVK